MIKIFNTPLLSLICLAMSIGLLSSCKKNDDVNTSSKIELLSFGPTGAKHGDTLRFFGHNLNKVTAIELTGASVTQSAFIQQTTDLILIIVPNEAVQGLVMLKTPEGDIISKTKLNFEVPVQITSITAEARPGANITIKGNFLNWVQSVTFGKDKIVDTFVSRSLTELVVKVPLDAQTDVLIFSTGGTEPLKIITTTPFKVTLPVVTGLSPNPVKHQTNLTITGTNLDLAIGVLFTGVTTAVSTFVSQTATQLVVKVPAGAKKGKISLVAKSTVTVPSTDELTMLLPVPNSLSPNPIAVDADLTITGTDLDLVTKIAFTGVSNPVTTFVSQSATQMVVKVPTGTLKGKLTFSVLNSSLTVESSQVLEILGGLPPLTDFTLPIYTDALQSGFQDWSWAGRDMNSTAIVRQGTKSIKATYGTGGYEGITFHAGTAVSTAGYTKVEFSVFGEIGTGGKKLNLVVNGGWTNPPQVTIVEGEWTTFTVNLSLFASSNPFSELVLQSAGWSGVIHIDHVGLR